jgi:hypothetical protein
MPWNPLKWDTMHFIPLFMHQHAWGKKNPKKFKIQYKNERSLKSLNKQEVFKRADTFIY